MANGHVIDRLAWTPLALALAVALPAAPAAAQNYEAHYGEDATLDDGADVASVRRCPDGGSIVVGGRRNPAFGTETLVTRVDDNGAPLWQHAYRVAGATFSRAEGVVELSDGSGFALTGSVLQPNSGTHIYVMRLSCEGRPRWTQVLSNQDRGHRAGGQDIIEVSDPLAPAPRWHLVVVGDEQVATPGNPVHGRIARLDPAGNLVFDHAYADPDGRPGMRFRAVTQAPGPGGGVDNLVVAGSLGRGPDWSVDRRALLFRVDARGAPVCNLYLGRPDRRNEDFNGIALQRVAPFSGQTVLVGATTSAANPDDADVYLARFRAGTCSPLAEAFWFDPLDGAVGHDLVESPRNVWGTSGAIVAAGTLRGPFTSGDGFALVADPSTLGPVGTPIRYGDQGRGAEGLRAIALHRDRYVLAGSTASDWNGTGDPQDVYLVQTTQGLRTQCALPWRSTWERVALPQERFVPRVSRLPEGRAVRTSLDRAYGDGYCCPLNPG